MQNDPAQTHAPDASIQDDLSGLTRDEPGTATPRNSEASVQDNLLGTGITGDGTKSTMSDQVRPWSSGVIVANIVTKAIVALFAVALFRSSVVGDPVLPVGAGLSVGLLVAALASIIGAVKKSRELALPANRWCVYLLIADHVAALAGLVPFFAGFAGVFVLVANGFVGSVTERQGLTEAELVEYDRKVKEKAERRRAHRRRD